MVVTGGGGDWWQVESKGAALHQRCITLGDKEHIQTLEVRNGCGYLACWMRWTTNKGQVILYGQTNTVKTGVSAWGSASSKATLSSPTPTITYTSTATRHIYDLVTMHRKTFEYLRNCVTLSPGEEEGEAAEGTNCTSTCRFPVNCGNNMGGEVCKKRCEVEEQAGGKTWGYCSCTSTKRYLGEMINGVHFGKPVGEVIAVDVCTPEDATTVFEFTTLDQCIYETLHTLYPWKVWKDSQSYLPQTCADWKQNQTRDSFQSLCCKDACHVTWSRDFIDTPIGALSEINADHFGYPHVKTHLKANRQPKHSQYHPKKTIARNAHTPNLNVGVSYSEVANGEDTTVRNTTITASINYLAYVSAAMRPGGC